MTPRYAMPDGDALVLAVQPRPAGEPTAVRISAFLDAAEDAAAQLARLPDTAGPLALRLDVGLPPTISLLDQRGLAAYLFPVAGHLARRTHRDFVSVWGTVGPDSQVRIDRATPAQVSAGDPDAVVDRVPGAVSHAAVSPAAASPAAASPAAVSHRVRTTASGDSAAYRQQIRKQLAGATELPPGPVRLELIFALNPRRPWINLWKPTIDSLGPLLGVPSVIDPDHARDGRIVCLGLHHIADPELAHEAVIDIIASAAY